MLDAVFARTRAARRPAFVPYIMAGDPDLTTTSLLLRALSRNDADLIELGVPYGDPLADGVTIAAAGMRALRQGVSIDNVFAVVSDSHVPVVLFSYYNPVLQYGLQRFVQNAAAAGVAGVIIPDVAFEEAGELRDLLAAHGLAMPLLVAPSTPLERAIDIASQSTGFVYVVSRLGVTGAGSVPDFAPLLQQVALLRTVTGKPLAVGFGLSSAAHLRAVRPFVDGVIVGSALIDAYGEERGERAVERVSGFVKNLLS